jgi:hypothetical protein
MTTYHSAIGLIHRTEPYVPACLLFLFSSLFFYALQIPLPLNVDTFLYARAIETFEGPLVHYGYYLIGALGQYMLRPVGATPLETLGYMSQFFGGISVAGMYVFTLLLTNNRQHALLGALILMFSGTVWLNSIHGEVYVPQLAFVLLSFICLLEVRPLLSGFSILVAITITPTSLLALIPAGYLMVMQHFTRKAIIAFAAPLLLAYAIGMLWEGPKIIETFAGAIYMPTEFVKPYSHINLLRLLTYHLLRAYGNAFNLICLFAVAGFAFLYSVNRRLWGLMLAFFIPFSAYFLNLGLYSADHLIITFIAVGFLGGFGVLELLARVHANQKAQVILLLLFICSYALVAYERSISRQTAHASELDRVVHNLSKEYHPNGILLTDFDFGVIFFSMMGKDYPYPLLKGNPNQFRTQQESQGKNAMGMLTGEFWIEFTRLLDVVSWRDFPSLIDGRPIYFAERQFWPMGLIQAYLPLRRLFGIVDKGDPKRLEHIREYLAFKLGTDVTVEKFIESPLYPVYVMRPGNKSAK